MTTPKISFEFFPPQNLEASFRLWDTVQVLAPMDPRFVSVTYGAGGTTRTLTRDAVATLHKSSGLNVAAHLTCVNASKAETLEIADQFAEAGVTEIVALRGDAPKGEGKFIPHPDGFANSVELIKGLALRGNFNIKVGAYPDRHPEAADQAADVEWLKRKLDAGANEALTQFFFEAETFFRFRDACEKAGIDGSKLTPGILPIENWKGARNFAKRCGTIIPDWVENAFEKALRDDREELLATAICTELCSDLLEGGVDKLHFYTLNRPELTRDVCFALGVTPKVSLQNVA
ncbi:methylenetetrahydrofolate reductase [NAD(P)H] [Leisingera sp. M527]|uniref:methylenetetrahydrofolate reductase [NAD(P)H] n=1 Tax=unclassified Leisingera TaxID=2614906 RepID=UPI0021A49CA9|nr:MULTISPECIES: methylenetetrahydrofolate reductase [NAD(P)H] [unclassified Leisingera]UWQ30098.1 methylenetetrahydrofolate reductase [NAD(P)H] [Leisingera sp. M523]UWQ34268.1 methylenetetrahydrofolate reductase [NAD(P)H] [Leisingera sp. M527]